MQSVRTTRSKIREFNRQRRTDERVLRVEQALREAESRHERELHEERHSRFSYLRIWLRRNGGPLLISQDEIREAGGNATKRLVFEVQPDSETLRISEATDEEMGP